MIPPPTGPPIIPSNDPLKLYFRYRTLAAARLAGNIWGRCQHAGRSEDPERRCCPDSAGKGDDRTAGEPASLRLGQTIRRALADLACFHGIALQNRMDRIRQNRLGSVQKCE